MSQVNKEKYPGHLRSKITGRPTIGDKIYVHSSRYVYRGKDDFSGGLATIDTIEYSDNLPEDHINFIMVGIKERPGIMYNWRSLISNQKTLKNNTKVKLPMLIRMIGRNLILNLMLIIKL